MTTVKTGLSQFWLRPWTFLNDLSVQVISNGPLATDGKAILDPVVIFATTSKHKVDKSAPHQFALKLSIQTKYEGNRCYAFDPERYTVTDPGTHTGLKAVFQECSKVEKSTDPVKRYKKFCGTF